MPRRGQTRANAVLTKFDRLSCRDLKNMLSIAVEYADHPSICNNPCMPAGDRLLRQLEFAYSELTGKEL